MPLLSFESGVARDGPRALLNLTERAAYAPIGRRFWWIPGGWSRSLSWEPFLLTKVEW